MTAIASLAAAIFSHRSPLSIKIASKRLLSTRRFASRPTKPAQDAAATNKPLAARTHDIEYTWDAGLALLPLEASV
jgi:hypothetical protein